MLSDETISEKVNIEAFFGVSAGKVWQCLNDRGEMDLNDIAICTSLRTEDVCYAMGWLGRGQVDCQEEGQDNKILVSIIFL